MINMLAKGIRAKYNKKKSFIFERIFNSNTEIGSVTENGRRKNQSAL